MRVVLFLEMTEKQRVYTLSIRVTRKCSHTHAIMLLCMIAHASRQTRFNVHTHTHARNSMKYVTGFRDISLSENLEHVNRTRSNELRYMYSSHIFRESSIHAPPHALHALFSRTHTSRAAAAAPPHKTIYRNNYTHARKSERRCVCPTPINIKHSIKILIVWRARMYRSLAHSVSVSCRKFYSIAGARYTSSIYSAYPHTPKYFLRLRFVFIFGYSLLLLPLFFCYFEALSLLPVVIIVILCGRLCAFCMAWRLFSKCRSTISQQNRCVLSISLSKRNVIHIEC